MTGRLGSRYPTAFQTHNIRQAQHRIVSLCDEARLGQCSCHPCAFYHVKARRKSHSSLFLDLAYKSIVSIPIFR